MKRVSILTASFGEGHNTAARNLRDALLEIGGDGVVVEICDLYQRTNPGFNRAIQVGYSIAINRFPRTWKFVFSMFGVRGVLENILPLLGSLREAMREHFDEFQPDIIVSTYPVFSFLVREIQRRNPSLCSPLVTVVTDSTSISSAWYRCASEAFCVADEPTADALRSDGVDPEKIHPLGFPVSLRFASLKSHPPDAHGPPWKILYYPSTRKGHTLACLDRLLRIQGIEITVLTGKNQALHRALCRAGYDRTPHVRIVGWTTQMPEILAAHHAFLGKAGGAIVQECLAAMVPILVSHVVPGQEEGNLKLIHALDIGALAEGTPDGLASAVEAAFANDAALWRKWKRNLASVSEPDGARKTARFCLSIETPTPTESPNVHASMPVGVPS